MLLYRNTFPKMCRLSYKLWTTKKLWQKPQKRQICMETECVRKGLNLLGQKRNPSVVSHGSVYARVAFPSRMSYQTHAAYILRLRNFSRRKNYPSITFLCSFHAYPLSLTQCAPETLLCGKQCWHGPGGWFQWTRWVTQCEVLSRSPSSKCK